MRKPNDPRELVLALLKRSQCHVQVAAVLSDDFGIHSWGWNSSGSTGLGEHAEAMTIRRANRDRLPYSTLWVAARRRKSGNTLTAKPCLDCQSRIWRVGGVVWRDSNGVWVGDSY